MDNEQEILLTRNEVPTRCKDFNNTSNLFHYLDKFRKDSLFYFELASDGMSVMERYNKAQELYEKYQNGEE